MTAIAANRPMSSQVGALARLDDVGRKLERQAAISQRA